VVLRHEIRHRLGHEQLWLADIDSAHRAYLGASGATITFDPSAYRCAQNFNKLLV
jgi:hypothetical protein